ncbi:hypothetical protein [Streptomyces sp. NPDC127066]|uniref:hypothetical protein n=1 Tax=Streptomyces sp. NPDC127066 TaxID=3347125 RepID=UPI00365346C0
MQVVQVVQVVLVVQTHPGCRPELKRMPYMTRVIKRRYSWALPQDARIGWGICPKANHLLALDDAWIMHDIFLKKYT